MTARVVPMRGSARSSSSWSDEAVALACASADPEAVAELFDRFHPHVTRYLSHLLRSVSEVEDLVQATFLEVARGRARFEGRSSVKSWLFGIATNMARHNLRTLARRRRLANAFRFVRSHTTTQTPGSITEARRELSRLQAALGALPESRRLAFVLCEIEGMSAQEAAEALGISKVAVWKRVSGARRSLLEAIREVDV